MHLSLLINQNILFVCCGIIPIFIFFFFITRRISMNNYFGVFWNVHNRAVTLLLKIKYTQCSKFNYYNHIYSTFITSLLVIIYFTLSVLVVKLILWV